MQFPTSPSIHTVNVHYCGVTFRDLQTMQFLTNSPSIHTVNVHWGGVAMTDHWYLRFLTNNPLMCTPRMSTTWYGVPGGHCRSLGYYSFLPTVHQCKHCECQLIHSCHHRPSILHCSSPSPITISLQFLIKDLSMHTPWMSTWETALITDNRIKNHMSLQHYFVHSKHSALCQCWTN